MTPEEVQAEAKWRAYYEDLAARNQTRRGLGSLSIAAFFWGALLPVGLFVLLLSRIYAHGFQVGLAVAEAQHHAQLEYLSEALRACAPPVGGNQGN